MGVAVETVGVAVGMGRLDPSNGRFPARNLYFVTGRRVSMSDYFTNTGSNRTLGSCCPQAAHGPNTPYPKAPGRDCPLKSAIYECGYNSCGCNLKLSEVRWGSFGVDLGPNTSTDRRQPASPPGARPALSPQVPGKFGQAGPLGAAGRSAGADFRS